MYVKAKDYWLRFEYQHRCSPHGIAWLQDAPDVQEMLDCNDNKSLQLVLSTLLF